MTRVAAAVSYIRGRCDLARPFSLCSPPLWLSLSHTHARERPVPASLCHGAKLAASPLPPPHSLPSPPLSRPKPHPPSHVMPPQRAAERCMALRDPVARRGRLRRR
eukprot:6188141-Pleurochrysis_carterae.AAC.4